MFRAENLNDELVKLKLTVSCFNIGINTVGPLDSFRSEVSGPMLNSLDPLQLSSRYFEP